jgi:hypothetical protein
MTDDDGQQRYHHNANEGETRGPAGEDRDPHHALNTPVEAIEQDDRDRRRHAEEDEGESLENADDRAEEERTSEERSRKD